MERSARGRRTVRSRVSGFRDYRWNAKCNIRKAPARPETEYQASTPPRERLHFFVKGVDMEIPGKVSLYCTLVDAKGTAATLVAVSPQGYYQVEVNVQGNRHTMFVPVAQAALYFSEPEIEREEGFEIER
jgi:hypothetical protein